MGQGSSLGETGNRKRTNFARAKGHSASYRGSEEWMLSRVLLVFLIPLSLYLVISLITEKLGNTYNNFYNWVNSPFHFTILILTIVIFGYTLFLEFVSIINDYIHHKIVNLFLVIFVKGLFYFLITLSIVSVFFILV